MPSSRRSTLTLEQIKKNARRLEKADALLTHKDALEKAAKEQGFPSFFAARQAIKRAEVPDPIRNFLEHLNVTDIEMGVRAVDAALSDGRTHKNVFGVDESLDHAESRAETVKRTILERYSSPPDAGEVFLASLDHKKMVELVALYWLGREDQDEPFENGYDVPGYFEILKGRAFRLWEMEPDGFCTYLKGRWAYFGCFLMRALELLCGDTLIASVSPHSMQMYSVCFSRAQRPDKDDLMD